MLRMWSLDESIPIRESPWGRVETFYHTTLSPHTLLDDVRHFLTIPFLTARRLL
jgi:hypothetical protein